MNKKQLLKQLSLAISLPFMLTICSCTTENKPKNTNSIPSINVKVYENNDTNLQNNSLKQNIKDNINTKEQEEKKFEPSKEKIPEVKPVEIPVQTIFKQGDKGSEVKEFQQKLNKFGYKLIEDGNFGASTYCAVLDFQMRNKITQDGIAGKLTLEKLNKAPTEETMYKPLVVQNPLPGAPVQNNDLEKYVNSKSFPSHTAYFIWLDIAHQKVNIFNGSNNNWHLIKSMICSSGKASTPTVKGTFTAGNKGLYFLTDYTIGGNTVEATCKYYTQITSNYLFHSVIYNSNGSKIIDGTLGVPVSHGCVRLSIDNAKYIYDNIPAGTAIWSN